MFATTNWEENVKIKDVQTVTQKLANGSKERLVAGGKKVVSILMIL